MGFGGLVVGGGGSLGPAEWCLDVVRWRGRWAVGVIWAADVIWATGLVPVSCPVWVFGWPLGVFGCSLGAIRRSLGVVSWSLGGGWWLWSGVLVD